MILADLIGADNPVTHNLMWVAREYGLWAAIVVYAFIRDTVRETRYSTQVNSLQTEMRGVVLPMASETASILAKNTVALNNIGEILNDVKLAVNKCEATLTEVKDVLADRGNNKS